MGLNKNDTNDEFGMWQRNECKELNLTIEEHNKLLAKCRLTALATGQNVGNLYQSVRNAKLYAGPLYNGPATLEANGTE